MSAPPRDDQRRARLLSRQVAGLLLLALFLLMLTLLRARPHSVFPPGWWRL